jgi:uncharacterized GH25 family protein
MMRRARSLLVSLAVIVLTPASTVQAHDYWLELEPLHAPRGGVVALSLHVGEDFVAAEHKAMQRDRTVSFRHLSRDGELDLLAGAVDGAKPLARVPVGSGGHLFGIERNLARIEMRALKFNRYLKHEGLVSALRDRKQARERLRRGRERYTRHLKAFMQVGDTSDGVSTRVLGHRIELVPERDLATLRPGERFTVTVLFEGTPLPGAMVEAFVRPRGASEPRGQKAVSDARGRVEFAATEAGAWLVRTVHMRRCAGCHDADWESFWAGYSFGL